MKQRTKVLLAWSAGIILVLLLPVLFILRPVFLAAWLCFRMRIARIWKIILFFPLLVSLIPLFSSQYAALFVAAIMMSDATPEQGINLPEHKFYGQIVRNVSYLQSYSRTIWEFDITEEEFRKLSKNFSQPTSEIIDPIRAGKFQDYRMANRENPSNDQEDYRKVKNGLISQYLQSNGGGYTLIFDRDAQRAYFYSSPC